MKKKVVLLMVIALVVSLFTIGCNENGGDEGAYPSGNIEIIVPYSAGGGGDTVARILADALGSELDIQVNVINREGAGGELGIAEIAASDADGYTLGVFGYPDNFVLENTRDTDFSFDDLEYLAAFDDMPMGIFAGPGSEFNTIEDVIAYGEDNPGTITIGESGALGLLHVLAFSEHLGIETTPVNFEGGGELMNAILGAHVDLASTSSMSHDPIKDGGGHPIGFAAAERMDMFPDVPTFKELGYNLEMGVSRVLVVPTGVPEEVKLVLTEALDTIGNDPELKERFENAALPYRYLDYDSVNEVLQRSNQTLLPVIESNQQRFE
ncbi:tripartite tricarboxylate transporter substrate binding protein [Tindallia californiensis]|uniref:Tripartite-type tricarboxylate transporter, receptor component TctC n=1 Tax=Tindallia californiensis TaxID=159292 RepID=A0A1H3QH46_9FIRM|nr:tripartite tricarboxylate transporter substrate binding protein [Tindallia californiensis]SDZ12726.1 Tripartite-type tricarboxylate transporter, receptor component TctC [Tindallia californiensis]